jgi:hypothetical protein
MLTLAQYIEAEGLSLSEFARRLMARLGRPVAVQNVFRWTRDSDHAEYSIPEPEALVAIYFETKRQVPIEIWYRHLMPRFSKRRKAA